ncbi:Zinc finger protein 678 [Colletotrichum sidae]|uniref:Zinc finger protein 678 n=1 Tax=Colletotrichum sidae TaxID=1347389 RepID=A0A4R8TEU4_9PEZI|nr:Zinc finger protein 678 [Colletotrichum sidae]
MAWNPNLIDDGTLPWVQTSAPQYLPFSNYDYMQDNGNNTPDLVHSSATNNFVKGAESGSERCCSVMGSPCDKPNCEDDKPVRCSVCNLALSAKQSLQQHMRIHTGEKPWKCTHEGCPQSFKQQSALTMHARTHTGAKPLSCSYCGKTFGESSNLSKHKKTHNEKGEHRCSICGKDFHRLDQLRRHNKIHEKRSGSGTAVASSPVEDLNRMTQKKPSGVRKGKKK